ncbi:RNA polymerase sigma-70 factor [Flavivirga aquimarina]|uniref:RNA polymerase sigma-70 factor n=1 Tax=Flavivirga aquimarina TaxID=2027862 RepID=A0ABT8W8E7_9FLAO|nr:RNA polymerase sigma-70 factor [Flavivirga aquimarina]MDO5969407.1 RNA polymerase sigma-70 factor [Flavivirga aquimarina]
MREGETKFTLKNYKKLFESLYPQLCVFAYKYLSDLELSKDIVQEVFLKVWEDKMTFQNENHTTGFFYKAVKNKCLNYLKSKSYKVTERYESANLKAHKTEEFNISEAVAIETTVVIENAIKKLPEKAAKVIRLSIEDYSNNEIAEELSISVNTVKDHKKSAYRKLRNLLGFLTIK